MYCYRTLNGEIFDREFPPGEAPDRISIGCNGHSKPAFRDRRTEMSGATMIVKGTENPTRQPRRGAWPMNECYASGVHSDQAQELRDHFKKNGLSIEVTPNGDPIYTSAKQRRKALKCRGLHDNASFD
jgi:hypothetical protein